MPAARFNQTDVPQLLRAAAAAARAAGQTLLQKLGHAQVLAQKSPRDDLLDADLEAERLLLAALQQATPDLGVLSEEAGHAGSRKNYWLLDPLDGSANFQHGSPLFAIAIALVLQETTVGGLIYLPASGEVFEAVRGGGAFLNGVRIHVSATGALEEAIAHVGDLNKGGDAEAIRQRLEELTRLWQRTRRVRMVGSAAIDLAYLACGRADLLVNHATAPWDIEAGKLLLLEAGGMATTHRTPSDRPLQIYSNALLHPALETLLT